VLQIPGCVRIAEMDVFSHPMRFNSLRLNLGQLLAAYFLPSYYDKSQDPYAGFFYPLSL